MSKNKTAIALFLMFAMTISLVAIKATPDANAQVTRATYPFIGALPNPVGVNQEVLLHVGISLPGVVYEDKWKGLWVTIERPDGKIDTIENIDTDSTGGTGRIYVPTMEGTYYIQTHFPEQVAERKLKYSYELPIEAGTIMEASVSEKLALVVTEVPVVYYPGVPLPTEYWSRPIDAQSREWASISASWMWGYDGPPDRFAPCNDDAPETAHILWAKMTEDGGLIGGEYGPLSFEHGDGYQGKWDNPAIIAGRLFYNLQISSGGTAVEQLVVAIDLHTGEELWCKTLGDNERLEFGEIVYWDTQNNHGAYAYLWTIVDRTTWNAYDPFTGRWEYTMKNVPRGNDLNIIGSKGEILRYTLDFTNGWMTCWNSTRVIGTMGNWDPHGKTYDNADVLGLEWNVTIPKGLPIDTRGGIQMIYPDRIIGSNTPVPKNNVADPPVFWGISLEPGQEGRLLFNVTWPRPIPDVNLEIPPGKKLAPSISQDCGVFVVALKETAQYYGFSLDTGKQLWGPTEPEPYMNLYTMIYSKSLGTGHIAYGRLYSAGMGGVVTAYNVTTGEKLWTYNATDQYSEILWGNNWPLWIMFITDGKLYLHHAEHSGIDPRPRGAPYICLDAETGEEIFKVDGMARSTRAGGQPIIGDSIIATLDTYDNRVYAIGKGPSATTVTAGPKVSVRGSNVLVEGMVIDTSPGTNDGVLPMRFPNGVPAVSDANQSDWMLYVYKQFARPADIVGVDVVVSVLDPNNNSYEVTRTTSDASGYFGCAFEPEVPGVYKIIATFEGSKAYYGSFAETFINVEEAPAATPEPTPTPASAADLYFVPMSIGMIVAIIVVGLVLVLMLRKR